MFKHIPTEKIERNQKLWMTIKDIFTVVAIVFAGIWGYYVYTLKDAPNLNKSFKISNTIKIVNFAEDPKNKFLDTNELTKFGL
jgi:uncharacterized membrane protein